MKLYNYLATIGAFTNGFQDVKIKKDTSDRQEKKMIAEAYQLMESSWNRRIARFQKMMEAGEDIDLAAEKLKFFPKEVNGEIIFPLQFVQDFIVRKIAGIQNHISIHNKKELAELSEVFAEYAIKPVRVFKDLTLERISWTAKSQQKPKLMVFAKDGEEPVCIRFEAANELSQKFLMAMLELGLKPGMKFSFKVEAVDPSIERNEKAGNNKAPIGKYVNHNLVLVLDGKRHTGHPPKGQRFNQKPTIEFMETLFTQALNQCSQAHV